MLHSDFDKIIPPLAKQNRAAYYFVRLDTISEISGHNWLLIVYIPDDSKVNLSPIDRPHGILCT